MLIWYVNPSITTSTLSIERMKTHHLSNKGILTAAAEPPGISPS